MIPFVGRCAVVLVVFVGLPWGAGALGTAVTGVSDEQVQRGELNEDDPAWDCRTMGNKDCGPTDVALCGPIGNPLGCPTWTGAK